MSSKITLEHINGQIKELEFQRNQYSARCAGLAGEVEHLKNLNAAKDQRIAALEQQIRDAGGEPAPVAGAPKPVAPVKGEVATAH